MLTQIDVLDNFIVNYKKRLHVAYKTNIFYKSFDDLYLTYPQITINLLNVIEKWGYYKDYFYILKSCVNADLKKTIYNIIVNKVYRDMYNFNNNNYNSTLAKWMPIENSPGDKKLKFVNTFCDELYGNHTRFTKKKYRLLMNGLKSNIYIIERILSDKSYDKVDFKRISRYSIEKNYNILIKNEILNDKMYTHFTDVYLNMNVKTLINNILNKKFNFFQIEKKVMIENWRKIFVNFTEKNDNLIMLINNYNFTFYFTLSVQENLLLCDVLVLMIISICFNKKFYINNKNMLDDIVLINLINANDLFGIIDHVSSFACNYDKFSIDRTNEEKLIIVCDSDKYSNIKIIGNGDNYIYWTLNNNMITNFKIVNGKIEGGLFKQFKKGVNRRYESFIRVITKGLNTVHVMTMSGTELWTDNKCLNINIKSDGVLFGDTGSIGYLNIKKIDTLKIEISLPLTDSGVNQTYEDLMFKFDSEGNIFHKQKKIGYIDKLLVNDNLVNNLIIKDGVNDDVFLCSKIESCFNKFSNYWSNHFVINN